MTISALRLRSCLRRFAREPDGVSAVEFAIVLPFMVALYIGSVELGDGMAINFKTTLAARTVADLVSQYTNVDGPTMGDILGAASAVLTPYSATGISVTVSEVTTTNTTGAASITWSCSLGGTPYTKGKSMTLPTNFNTLAKNISLIFGEVTYPYTPAMGYAVTGTINLYQSIYFYPRMSTTVTPPTSVTSPVKCNT